jgi:hypothetical protein
MIGSLACKPVQERHTPKLLERPTAVSENPAPRKGPTVLPWIVGLLVLALLVWVLVEAVTDETEPEISTPPASVWIGWGGVTTSLFARPPAASPTGL